MPEVTLRSDLTLDVIQQMGDDLMIAMAAWVSTGRDQTADKEKIEGVLKFLMNNRHGTPFEHGALTIRVDAPIFIWREWHRHRIGWSYNEVSGRYSQLQPVFYIPGLDRGLNCLKPEGFKPSKPGWRGFLAKPEADLVIDNTELLTLYQQAYDLYERRLRIGYDNGLARIDLPVAIYSACYCTCNPRSIMAFLELRTDREEAKRRSHPLWELDHLATKLEAAFQQYWPLTHKLWNDNGRMAP